MFCSPPNSSDFRHFLAYKEFPSELVLPPSRLFKRSNIAYHLYLLHLQFAVLKSQLLTPSLEFRGHKTLAGSHLRGDLPLAIGERRFAEHSSTHITRAGSQLRQKMEESRAKLLKIVFFTRKYPAFYLGCLSLAARGVAKEVQAVQLHRATNSRGQQAELDVSNQNCENLGM